MFLNPKAEQLIINLLGLNTIDDIIDTPFSDTHPPKNDQERTKAMRYSNRYRGSVRLTQGLFYTEQELESKREKALNSKLP